MDNLSTVSMIACHCLICTIKSVLVIKKKELLKTYSVYIIDT